MLYLTSDNGWFSEALEGQIIAQLIQEIKKFIDYSCEKKVPVRKALLQN
jgi:hypothetical protein